jgi:hypothetical protein
MLVREVTKDPEGLTDPGIHHFRYAYLPHSGTAAEARPWLAAYNFNQPLIPSWRSNGHINVQLSFDKTTPLRQFEDTSSAPKWPDSFGLLSAQNAIVADIYRNGEQVEALAVSYDTTSPATLQFGEQQITLSPIVFTITPISLPAELPIPLE